MGSCACSLNVMSSCGSCCRLVRLARSRPQRSSSGGAGGVPRGRGRAKGVDASVDTADGLADCRGCRWPVGRVVLVLRRTSNGVNGRVRWWSPEALVPCVFGLPASGTEGNRKGRERVAPLALAAYLARQLPVVCAGMWCGGRVGSCVCVVGRAHVARWSGELGVAAVGLPSPLFSSRKYAAHGVKESSWRSLRLVLHRSVLTPIAVGVWRGGVGVVWWLTAGLACLPFASTSPRGLTAWC